MSNDFLGYCRPREIKTITIEISDTHVCTVGLKPTQRWRIIGWNGKQWTLRRHNIVISLDADDFLRYFYRDNTINHYNRKCGR